MHGFKKSLVSKQNLPSPERYGWEFNSTSLDPIMTDNLPPAPLALGQLSNCNCKGGCSTRRSKCFKFPEICSEDCDPLKVICGIFLSMNTLFYIIFSITIN